MKHIYMYIRIHNIYNIYIYLYRNTWCNKIYLINFIYGIYLSLKIQLCKFSLYSYNFLKPKFHYLSQDIQGMKLIYLFSKFFVVILKLSLLTKNAVISLSIGH